MARTDISDRVSGKTLRWTFAEGPQAGKTYEHTFHADGTVEYLAIEDDSENTPSGGQGRGAGSQAERPMSSERRLRCLNCARY